jgi:hypothetical protein
MLAGHAPEDLVTKVQKTWIDFVRNGHPGWSRDSVHHIA